MLDYNFAIQENRRHTLMTFARILSENGFEVDLTDDGSGIWSLDVKVPGPSKFPAKFTLTESGDDALTLSAFFVSPLVKEGLIESWTITASDSPAEICDELITYFVMDCSDKEFEAVLVPTMINDSNLEYFVQLLSDRILTEENVYALGAYIQDEGGLEVAAACGFFMTEDELIIEDIAVMPAYEDLGIEDYLMRYVQHMIIDSDLI